MLKKDIINSIKFVVTNREIILPLLLCVSAPLADLIVCLSGISF